MAECLLTAFVSAAHVSCLLVDVVLSFLVICDSDLPSGAIESDFMSSLSFRSRSEILSFGVCLHTVLSVLVQFCVFVCFVTV